MHVPPSFRCQRGYFLEIPLLLMGVAIVFALVMPRLPPVGQKILLGVVTPLVLFGLFYMIVIPGWRASDTGRLKPPWSVLVFGIVAGVILVMSVAFILRS